MGYSFTWILNHLSQSYQVASASWAGYAVSASYVPLLAGPNITINYQPNGIAISSSAAGATTFQITGSTQADTASFNAGGDILLLTGSNSMRVTVTDSGSTTTASFGIPTDAQVTFGGVTSSLYGTASWAISSSWSVLSITASYITASGIDGLDDIWVRSLGTNTAVIDDTPTNISIATGYSAVAYGKQSIADGDFSQAQGLSTEAIGVFSHAEGASTYAVGSGSHTEGYDTRTGLPGEPILVEVAELTGSLGAWPDGTINRDSTLLTINNEASSLYNLSFLITSATASWEGSNTLYESGSIFIIDNATRSLVGTVDLTPLYNTGSTMWAIPDKTRAFHTAWYNPDKDRVYMLFQTTGPGFGTIFWFSGSFDGINPPSIYLNNTASLGHERSYDPTQPSFRNFRYTAVTSYAGTTVAYNSINKKTYFVAALSGIAIMDENDEMEYTSSAVYGNVGVASGIPLTFIGDNRVYKTSLSASAATLGGPAYPRPLIYQGVEVDSRGNVWCSYENSVNGLNTTDIFVITASAHISSSDADFFKYKINIQNMGISASVLTKPYYLPSDGTPNSEQMILAVQYPYGSGSYNYAITKTLSYDLDGNLRNSDWGGVGGDYLNQYYYSVYYWPAENIVVKHRYLSGGTPRFHRLDGTVITYPYVTSSARYGSGNTYDYNFGSPVHSNDSFIQLHQPGGFFPAATNLLRSSSITWLERQVTHQSVGPYSHAEGISTTAVMAGSHAEGYYTVTSGSYSHVEGAYTKTVGSASHAEGYYATASGDYSHAEGVNTISYGIGAHAEGSSSHAHGNYAHAEGAGTQAIGNFSHAEGSGSEAYASGSHAMGLHTIASRSYQTTLGEYNLRNNTYDYFVIGNGTSDSNRSDLLNAGGTFVRITGSLIVSNSFNLIGTGRVTGSFIVSGSLTTIGVLTVSGSFIDTGSFNLIGTGNITGSLIISNSLNVIGTSTVTGSNIISGSQNVIGTSNVTGSNNISGSWNLVGSGVVTGSLTVSGSSTTIGSQIITGSLLVTGSQTNIGTTTITGSNNITGSWNLTGPGTITGSLIVSNSLTVVGNNITSGSTNITGSLTVIGNQYLTGSLQMNGPTASISGVDYIDFDTQYIVGNNEPTWKEGRLFYDSGSGALSFYNWEQDVTLNIGQEQWLRARNQTGVTITNGSVVKLSGAIGDRPTIILAQSTDQINTFAFDNDIIGMVTHDIENGTDGFVTTFGLVNGVDTNAFNAGDLLWVSQSAGQYTNIPPSAPYDKIFVGVVTRKNVSTGTIFVTTQTPIHFHDISSVSASVYTQGDLWMFRASGSSGIWTNTKTLSGSYVLSGSLTAVDGGITGSLFGTASWANSSSWTQPGGPYTSIQFNDSNTLSGSANYTFNENNNEVQLTGSLMVSGTVVISSSNTNQTQPAFAINSDGLLVLGEFITTPTAIPGAMMYSGSDYYLGF